MIVTIFFLFPFQKSFKMKVLELDARMGATPYEVGTAIGPDETLVEFSCGMKNIGKMRTGAFYLLRNCAYAQKLRIPNDAMVRSV